MNNTEHTPEKKNKSAFPVIAVVLFLIAQLMIVVLNSFVHLIETKTYLWALGLTSLFCAATLVLLPFIIKNKVARYILFAVALCHFAYTAYQSIYIITHAF